MVEISTTPVVGWRETRRGSAHRTVAKRGSSLAGGRGALHLKGKIQESQVPGREAARPKVLRQEQAWTVSETEDSLGGYGSVIIYSLAKYHREGAAKQSRRRPNSQQPERVLQVWTCTGFASSPASSVRITVWIYGCSPKLPGWPKNTSPKQLRLNL